LSYAVMNGPAAVVITDAEGTIEYVNRKFSALTGYPRQEAIGQKASLLKSGLMPESCYRTLWRHLRKGEDWTGEFHNRKKSGETYWEQASISPVRDAAGRLRHYLKIAEDITERKRLEGDLRASLDTLRAHDAQLQATCKQLDAATRALKKSQSKLQRLSQEDALTGLLNRRGFDAELLRAKALAERQGRGIGFLIIDIDHFKQVNDRHGHAAGDRILKGCATLLRSRLRASDLICRYGGDELVVALPSADAETTRRTAERILAAVRKHDFSKAQAKLFITVSIGAACGLPAPGQSLEQVMKLADRALYRVKQSGRDGVAFWSSGDERSACAARRARCGDRRPLPAGRADGAGAGTRAEAAARRRRPPDPERPAARHRQSRHSRCDPAESRPADRPGAEGRARARAHRARHPRGVPGLESARRDHALPSRAPGRLRLPARAQGRAHQPGRTHSGCGRHL
jgi:diguanylate cyclase (GGDEF)-like protein/PAS domain S-box-containing protein